MDPRHVKEVMEQAALKPETVTVNADVLDPGSRHQAGALLWANLPVIVGVAFLGWRIHEVMYLYWLDCFVLGLFTFLRILRCEPERPDEKPLAAVMFLLVYIGLLVFFELFVRDFFPPPGVDRRHADLKAVLTALFSQQGMVLAFLAMVVSHIVAFIAYLSAGKFRVKEPKDATAQAGTRIAVLMMYLMGAGFANDALHSPTLAVIIFVGVKVFYDLKLYRDEAGQKNVT